MDLLKLNARDATNNLNVNLGLVLIAYRNTMEILTGYTLYFL